MIPDHLIALVRSRTDAPKGKVIRYICADIIGSRAIKIRLIRSGLSSWNYKVRHPKGVDIVRLSPISENRNVSGMQREDNNMYSALTNAGLHVTPSVRYYLVDSFLVSQRRYIPGEPLIRAKNLSRDAVGELGTFLARIHKCKPALERPSFYRHVFLERSNEWLQELVRSSRDLFSEEIRRRLENQCCVISKNARILGERAIQVKSLCHLDFKTDNIIRSPGGKLTIIDWEKACLSDPLFDLGLALMNMSYLLIKLNKQSELTNFLHFYAASSNNLQDCELGQIIAMFDFAVAAFYCTDALIVWAFNEFGRSTPASKKHAEYFRQYCNEANKAYYLQSNNIASFLSRYTTRKI